MTALTRLLSACPNHEALHIEVEVEEEEEESEESVPQTPDQE